MGERMTTIRRLAAVALALGALLDGRAHAAGPWISETGGADMGLAGAGRAALALDPAALSANPASLAGLHDGEVTLAAVPLELDYAFRGEDGYAGHARNHDAGTVLPAAYGVARRGDWALGFGAYSGFGLSFDHGRDWEGARTVSQAGVATVNVGPSVAWQAGERVSLGASIVAQWARPDFQLDVANDAAYYGPPANLPDGHLEFRGDDWATGAQLGASVEVRTGLRVGASWTSPVGHRVALDVEGHGLHPVLGTLLPPDGVAKLRFTTPQQVMLGATWSVTDATLLAAGATWQDWSRFGAARLSMPGYAADVFPAGLRDTWGASVGVRRALDERWTVSGGVAYESSPAPSGGVPIYFPVAEQWRMAGGLEREVSDALRLRASLTVMLQGDARVVQAVHPLPVPGIPTYTGRYADTRVYALGLGADFRL